MPKSTVLNQAETARKLLSFRAYARHRQVSLRAVQKAIAAGRIQTVPDKKGKPKIDPEAADKLWESLTDIAKRPPPEVTTPKAPPPGIDYLDPEGDYPDEGGDPGSGEEGEGTTGNDGDDSKSGDYYKFKARRERYTANLARLKYLKEAGELVEAKVIQAEWQKIVTTTKTRLLAVHSKVRNRVPHLTAEDVATIEEEIRDALEELSHGAVE